MKTSKIGMALAVLFLYSFFATTAFAAGDNILSGNIKEADGTTGQDTNNGSGVKTGHIQDGAVTDAKITGPISGSKISSTGLNADTVDGLHGSDFALSGHNHDGVYQKKYGKMAVVAQTGGDYTDPVAAMNGLATWCGTPSATNLCLLKIMPGVYDITGNSLQMREYVDIEGSGENATKISGDFSTWEGRRGVVLGASNAEIRFLTIESLNNYLLSHDGLQIVGSSPKITNVTFIEHNNVSIFVAGNGRPVLNNVTVINDGWVGIEIDGASAVLTNVRIIKAGTWGDVQGFCFHTHNALNDPPVLLNNVVMEAWGPRSHGVSITNTNGTSGGTIDMMNVKISSSDGYGIWQVLTNAPGTVKIKNSAIKSALSTLNISGGNAQVAYTQLDGASISGSAKCIGVYDGNFDPLTCP